LVWPGEGPGGDQIEGGDEEEDHGAEYHDRHGAAGITVRRVQ
jgi:hypothetical protein